MTKNSKRAVIIRLTVAILILASCFILVGRQLYKIQISRHEEFIEIRESR